MPYIGNPIYQSAFVTDTFSGNGSTTAFTMSVAPAGTTNVLVAVSGVLQDPSTYGVVGTTITFSAAPPSGTGNISCRYLGVPATGVTTTAYRTVTEFTATAGQTTFTPPSYTVGFINVYRNGVLLGSADYTATNGTTVVLTTGTTSGDLVTVESFLVSSVLNAIPNIAGSVGSSNIVTGVTLTSPNTAGTPTGVGVLTSGTAVASTSGTSIDFTGIPSWVKRITVMFNGVSTTGTSTIGIRLGTSGGVVATGYNGSAADLVNTGTVVSAADTTMLLLGAGSASQTSASVRYGIATISLLDSSTNTWVHSGSLGFSNTAMTTNFGGRIALASALTTVRITAINGTDAFDAGSINILYE